MCRAAREEVDAPGGWRMRRRRRRRRTRLDGGGGGGHAQAAEEEVYVLGCKQGVVCARVVEEEAEAEAEAEAPGRWRRRRTHLGGTPTVTSVHT